MDIKTLNFQHNANDSEEVVLWKIGRAKDNGLLGNATWEDIATYMNELFGHNKKESAYRKPYVMSKKLYEANVFVNVESSDELNKLKEQTELIRKERQKLLDERRDINKRLREVARSEEDLDIFKDHLINIAKDRYIEYSHISNDYISEIENDMVVCLSDLHIGAEWNHFTGNYNSSIAKDRLSQYLSEVIRIGKLHNVYKVVICGVGDFISGQIHTLISLTNRENLVEQTKLACEYISDFVYEIGKNFGEVEVHMCAGNHSRLHKKEDSLIDERLDILPLWFMKHMFSHVDNIIICDDETDKSLFTFTLFGHMYMGIHGDYDSLNDSAILKLCAWRNINPTCIFTGHMHHSAMTEISGIKVIQSGSLCGTGDEYTRSKRLIGKPSQTVAICDKHGIRAVYPIQLK